jgi:DNA-directed RNA polymerase specialized sigma24 family protein
MAGDTSVTHWIEQLKSGDEAAAQQELWNRYFERLVGLARKKLRSLPQRAEDEEDVVLSAMDSFFDGARRGQFPQLSDRGNLWPLLVKITARKAMNQLKKQRAIKRGAGQVRGESVFVNAANLDRQPDMGQVVGHEPTPEFAVQTSEQCQRLLSLLSDELREVAELKLQNFSNGEIAQRMGVVERTVERKLNLIRKHWSQELEEAPA